MTYQYIGLYVIIELLVCRRFPTMSLKALPSTCQLFPHLLEYRGTNAASDHRDVRDFDHFRLLQGL